VYLLETGDDRAARSIDVLVWHQLLPVSVMEGEIHADVR
jgi:hypothetical protein